MWSVVTESASIAMMRASVMFEIVPGSVPMPLK